jgi:DeoR/GlpR family transcriptional regulator of sugar metabolism
LAKPINNERRNKIVNYVISNGSATVNDLAKEFNVSTETIRKDLTSLHENNILSKGHGTVTVASSYLENEFALKESDNLEAKIHIAQRAATQVPQNGVIFLDSGTTALQLAKILNLRDDLIIVSNSAIAAQVLSTSKNQILITGGELRKKSLSYVGNWALKAINHIKIDIAFLSCSGFHADGPSIHSYRELEIKQAVIKSAKKTILMVNTSKIVTESLYRYVSFSAFDLMITERKLTPEEREKFPETLNIMDY